MIVAGIIYLFGAIGFFLYCRIEQNETRTYSVFGGILWPSLVAYKLANWTDS